MVMEVESSSRVHACIQGDGAFDSDNDGLVGLQEFALALAMWYALRQWRYDGANTPTTRACWGELALVGRS